MNKINISSVLFCRIAWMKHYRGPSGGDTPKGGGSYVDKNHSAFEEYNFSYHEGRAYGYVRGNAQSKVNPDNKSINLEKIDPANGKISAYIDDVTVIFFAKNPRSSEGSFIVGWYKNATVYRELQTRPDNLIYELLDGPYLYNLEAKESDTHLVPEEHRNHQIPRGENTPGQSNIFYYNPNTNQLMDEALAYVNEHKG